MNPDFMQQIQEIQRRAAELQKGLAAMEVQGSAGGGLVRALMNGMGELKSISIDPSLLKPEDQRIVEDLVVAACADAKNKLENRRANDTQFISELMKNFSG